MKAITVIIVSLLIDLLSFTTILPLFPRILLFYKQTDPTFQKILNFISVYRQQYTTRDIDIILIGGLIGSAFSILQFIVSPIIGSLSDQIGRRKTLLLSMIGNAISMLLWINATDFKTFLFSRLIGGLTEGNVQLSIAMISDISNPENRGRNMALVGMCFAVGFTFGPPLGAYLTAISATEYEFRTPAIFAFMLIIIETLFMYIYLPETLVQKPVKSEKVSLKFLSAFHFMYLFLFSGMEFTITFLTFDRFKYTNTQQGKLLGVMGVCTALIQGGWVRRQKHKEKIMAVTGLISCSIGLFIMAFFQDEFSLYLAILFLSVTSGTVVTCLNSIASAMVAEKSGQRLGEFRSAGQLGRALGPVIACTLYWIWGAEKLYAMSSASMLIIAISFSLMFQQPTPTKKKSD